ncbi:hypothetical protein LEP1GSC126_2973 [Leptospira kirschneri str. 200801774]|nr:hypothetical protein LEP1GSC126_2973 [Leptospira kirschneri str. 200801774]
MLCSFSNKPQDITKEIIKNIIIWNILRCVFLRNFFIFSPLYFSLLISYVFHQSYIRSLLILRLLCLYFVLLRLITPSFQRFHFDYEKVRPVVATAFQKILFFCDIITKNVSNF